MCSNWIISISKFSSFFLGLTSSIGSVWVQRVIVAPDYTQTHTHTHTHIHGRTSLYEWSARHRSIYLYNTIFILDSHPCRRRDSNPQSQQRSGRRPTPIWFFWSLLYMCTVFFFLLALQPPLGVVFYSPLADFSHLAYEVSWSHTTTRHIR